MFFKAGDKVVCVDDKKNNPRIDIDFKEWIVEGKQYSIRSTSMDLNGNQGVLLNEVKNPSIHSNILGGNFEPRFASIRFVKIEGIFLEEDVEENKLTEEICF